MDVEELYESIANALPIKLKKYINKHECQLEIGINRTTHINGYGVATRITIKLYRYAEWCNRPTCKYHSLYNPNAEYPNGHYRHTIERDYLPVWGWNSEEQVKSENGINSIIGMGEI